MSLSPASSEESYPRLGLCRSWRRARGFRLCTRKHRFSVRRLRAKLLAFLGIVGRLARHLRRHLSASSARRSTPCPRSGSARAIVGQGRYSQGGEATAAKTAPRRATPFMRSSSFYAQAVTDCLEFIKQNSVPVQDYPNPVVGVRAAGR
jgi:hypothetical protein